MTPPEDTPPTPRSAQRLRLRIAATSDLHMHLLGYDYHADAPAPGVGLARVATRIAEARAEVPGLLLFDNGDFLQGTPLGDYAAQARPCDGRAHPMIAAMNRLAYDAVALGNHEFDYGLEVLEAALAGADFPVLGANLLRRRGAGPLEDEAYTRPWVLLERALPDAAGVARRLRIGVIGLSPPQVLQWDREQLEGRLEVRCMIEAARAHVPAMRAAGADVVVALAHCGPSARPEAPGMEHALLPLAGIDGIDALVAGHVHRLIPGPHFAGVPGMEAEAGRVAGKPCVMPGIGGSHLGVIDLWLEPGAEGWRVAEASASLRPVAWRGGDGDGDGAADAGLAQAGDGSVPEAPAITSTVAADHAATLAYIRRPMGHSEMALQSYTSFVAPCPVVQAINAAQSWFVRRALPDAGLPVLSAAAPFKAGGPAGPDNFIDIPAGPLSYRDLAALYPFPNTLRAIRVTGAQLHDWLERAAGAFNRLGHGQPDQPLLNPEFPSYDFDVIAGLTWEIDLSRPALWGHDGEALGGGGRIRNLRHAGRPVEADAAFILATNSYRLSGGGLYAPLAGAEVVLASETASRDVLIRHIAAEGTLRGPLAACWRFTPLGGCPAVLETGAGVRRHLGGLTASGARQPRLDGQSAAGFQRLRLCL